MSLHQKRVLIYSRVSTVEQNPHVQLFELRKFCEARGWAVAEEIVDLGFSGANDKRPGLQKLLSLARGRQIDIVVVVKLDRLFRSLKHLVTTLQELTEDLGVDLVSLRDQIDMTTASGKMLVHILGAFSEFERSLIVERTRAGIAHARSKGKRLGRPPASDQTIGKILEMRAQGHPYHKIQVELKVSKGLISNAINNARKKGSNNDSNKQKKTGASNGE